jgi:hypothetical protein
MEVIPAARKLAPRNTSNMVDVPRSRNERDIFAGAGRVRRNFPDKPELPAGLFLLLPLMASSESKPPVELERLILSTHLCLSYTRPFP